MFRSTFRTITVDNGSEFSDCSGMERSRFGAGQRTKIYYCHPYSAYERGSNENLNKMIRRHYPKGTDFSRVSARRIREVQDWINGYPRGIFDYRSSNDLFSEEISRLKS